VVNILKAAWIQFLMLTKLNKLFYLLCEQYWGGRIIKFGEAKFDYFSAPNLVIEE